MNNDDATELEELHYQARKIKRCHRLQLAHSLKRTIRWLYFLPHLLTRLLTHTVTNTPSFTHSSRPPSHSPFNHAITHPVTNSALIDPLTHLLTYSLTHAFTRSLTHSQRHAAPLTSTSRLYLIKHSTRPTPNKKNASTWSICSTLAPAVISSWRRLFLPFSVAHIAADLPN